MISARAFSRLVACALVVLVSALYTSPALACATCFDPRDKTNGAFAVSTAFLSLLPLGFIAATVWWLWRQFKTPPPSPPN